MNELGNPSGAPVETGLASFALGYHGERLLPTEASDVGPRESDWDRFPVFLLIQLDLRGFVFLIGWPVAANLDNEKLSA